MKIFVSHSLKDKELLTAIQDNLGLHGFDLLIAEHTLEFNKSISEKIKGLIHQCDVGLIMLTENGLNSSFVSEEIGYLEAKGKPIIRIIQKGLGNQYSGFKYGADYIEWDPDEPSSAHELLKQSMMKIDNKIKLDNRNALIFVAAIFFLLLTSEVESTEEKTI